ncbi:oocyte zinc finger protein XlCOF8.4-like [Toxotes jaculatrix]|uniref:oocyte zinc finger protein XlCOF8.4-like n=1 Tax=Toxotes jaculatrix TaxID=941984 RepID=UPI001B3A9414|nr:oocyte zinc finger protein XlCOF8.4-like [Toxotes jaculatrix]
MSALDSLKEFMEQRLAAAVEDIFEYFQKTIAEYEEELGRYRKLLDTVLLPEIRLRREDVPSLTVNAKIPPEQQGIQSSLHQEHPQSPCIKEEQEEVWTSPEGEQLQGLEGADIPDFPFPPTSVKSESDNVQLSELCQSQTEESTEADPPAKSTADQMETAADGEDCEGSVTDVPSDNSSLCCSEPGIKNDDDLNRFNGRNMCKPFSCLFWEKCFCSKSEAVTHERGHTSQKPSCRTPQQTNHFKSHLKVHTGERAFRCSDCGECFSHRAPFKQHVMHHKGEKPFSGRRACGRRFTWKSGNCSRK